ncbi:SpoIIE family protein phosphatase [Streptomyces sp. NPDC096354]|uniref:SpoIIE family protein phosphatase n=1 Tax=Streptomyces sp. NPDC096354 TaxID=3366088 RepID=UPI0038210299
MSVGHHDDRLPEGGGGPPERSRPACADSKARDWYAISAAAPTGSPAWSRPSSSISGSPVQGPHAAHRPHAGRVTGTSAGHVPLLCAHRDGSHDVRELPGGPLLGSVPDTDHSEETFTLDEDSAPVMVADDVVEGPGLALSSRPFSCSCCSAAAMA